MILARRKTTYGKTKNVFVKIGHSKNPEKRFDSINYSTPMILKKHVVVKFEKKEDALKLENEFKTKFKQFNFKGEWFELIAEDVLDNWFMKFLIENAKEVLKWE